METDKYDENCSVIHQQVQDDLETMDHKELGAFGEKTAASYLELSGYTILERNWSCPFGEADIIAQDPDDNLVFIEVKTRRSLNKGFPEEAITPQKRSKYERIALCYIQDAPISSCSFCFDVIGIVIMPPNRACLKHHKNAFASGD